MKRKLERIVELSIIGALILILVITYQDHSLESNLCKIIEIVLWIGIYITHVKWLIPKFLNEKRLKYLIFSIIVIAVSIIIGVFFKAVHLEEMNYRRYYSIRPAFDYILNFEWSSFRDMINGVLISYVISSVYGILRNVKLPDKTVFQKVVPITSFSIILLYVIGFVSSVCIEEFKEYPKPDYKTVSKNEKTHFLNNDSLYTFLDIINKVNNGKPVCVLFWAKSCYWQRYNLTTLNKIKKEMPNNKIDFLYICGEYEGEDDYDRWKDAIISEDIEGFSIYLKREHFHQIFIEELGLQNGLLDENLLLLNAKHEIVNKLDFPLDNKNELIDKINEL